MNTKNFFKTVSIASFISMIGISAIAHAEDRKSPSDNVMTALSDTAITTKIKAKYLDDIRFKNTDISVTTVRGVVTLTGSAPTSETKRAAEDIAKYVEGVVSVENNIIAPSIASQIEDKTKAAAKKTGRVVSDGWITTKVKSALLADSITKGFKINVTTKNHVVTLSGVMNNQAAADQAVYLATQIEGVQRVDSSELKVGKN